MSPSKIICTYITDRIFQFPPKYFGVITEAFLLTSDLNIDVYIYIYIKMHKYALDVCEN